MRVPLLKLFTLLAVTSSSLVSAQATFTPAHDTVDITYPGTGFLDVHNDITVPGADSVDIAWGVIDEDFSDDPTWIANQNTVSICDNFGCYTNAVQAILNGTIRTAKYPPGVTDIFKGTFNLEGANPGSHFITFLLKDNGSSFDTTITFFVNKWATGTTTVTKKTEDIILFPNPAQDEVNVVFSELNIKNIAVYNVIGKNMIVYRTSGTSAKMDISKLPGGVYFLRMSDANGAVVATKRITKQ